MVAVRCLHCGARYETDLPIRAIERIRRCSCCGHAALVTVPGDDSETSGTGRPADRDADGDTLCG